MTRVWNDIAGVCLAGEYRLDQFVGSDESAAWFLTMSRSGERAAIKLIPEDPATSSEQLAAWRAARLLSHSNLLPMFDCGHTESPSGPVLYAVFEYPDDNLAAALKHGTLDESDTRETLAACLAALRYVHSHGMVHGSVDAEHILAVGDRVKLASDTLRPIATAGGLPEDDIRALHQVLRVPYTPPAALSRPIPEPLPEPKPRAAAVDPDEESEPRTIPNWIYGAAAGLVIAIVLAFAVKPSSSPKSVSTPPPQSAPATPPPAVSPRPRPSRPVPAADPVPPQEGRSAWRVVVYTYNRYRDAEKKARSINARWPGLHATVFAPKGRDRRPYFVALGGRMTHAEALNLRHVARSKGLPRDTFVRNYSD